jgi:hypothetical protein
LDSADSGCSLITWSCESDQITVIGEPIDSFGCKKNPENCLPIDNRGSDSSGSNNDTDGGRPRRGDGSGSDGGRGPEGRVRCGPQGQFWVPGTGYHPDSLCFQDQNNIHQAEIAIDSINECNRQGGSWSPVPNGNGNGIIGIDCKPNNANLPHFTSTPTTSECFKWALDRLERVESEKKSTDGGSPAPDELEGKKNRIKDRTNPRGEQP